MVRESSPSMSTSKRDLSLPVAVPQNFIPGLTKPRLSLYPDPDSDSNEREKTSERYHGVTVRIPEEISFTQRLALQAGLIAMSLPTPSKHVDCGENAVTILERLQEGVKKKSRVERRPSSETFLDFHDKTKLMEHRKVNRSMTAPSIFRSSSEVVSSDEEEDFLARSLTLPSKGALLKPALASRSSCPQKLSQFMNLEGLPRPRSNSRPKIVKQRKVSLSSSLPDITLATDSDDQEDMNLQIAEKRFTRSFSCVLENFDEVKPNSRAARRKYSRALIKKAENLQEKKQKENDKKEREMYGALQDVMRSKLPKTFQATASMFNPVQLSGAASKAARNKKTSKGKNEVEIKRKRAGSLPAVLLNRLSHHQSSDQSEQPKPANAKRSKVSLGVASKIEKITGSPKIARSLDKIQAKRSVEARSVSVEERRYNDSTYSDNQDTRHHRDSSSSNDSGIMMKALSGDENEVPPSPITSIEESSDSKISVTCKNCNAVTTVTHRNSCDSSTTCESHDTKTEKAHKPLTRTPSSVPSGLQTFSEKQGTKPEERKSSVKVQTSLRRKKTSYQVNIKVNDNKQSVDYKQISTNSIKIRSRLIRGETQSISDEPVTEQESSSSEQQDTNERRPSLTKLPPPQRLLATPAPVISKLHVVRPVSPQPPRSEQGLSHRRKREEIKAILENFKNDTFTLSSKRKLTTSLSTPTSSVQSSGTASPVPASSSVMTSPSSSGQQSPSSQSSSPRFNRKVVKAPRWKGGGLILRENPAPELAVHDAAAIWQAKTTSEPVHVAQSAQLVIRRKISATRTKVGRSSSNVAEYLSDDVLAVDDDEMLTGHQRTKSEPKDELEVTLDSLQSILDDLEEFTKVFDDSK